MFRILAGGATALLFSASVFALTPHDELVAACTEDGNDAAECSCAADVVIGQVAGRRTGGSRLGSGFPGGGIFLLVAFGVDEVCHVFFIKATGAHAVNLSDQLGDVGWLAKEPSRLTPCRRDDPIGHRFRRWPNGDQAEFVGVLFNMNRQALVFVNQPARQGVFRGFRLMNDLQQRKL